MKILVCIDLLFTVPIVLAASRVLVEGAVLGSPTVQAWLRGRGRGRGRGRRAEVANEEGSEGAGSREPSRGSKGGNTLLHAAAPRSDDDVLPGAAAAGEEEKHIGGDPEAAAQEHASGAEDPAAPTVIATATAAAATPGRGRDGKSGGGGGGGDGGDGVDDWATLGLRYVVRTTLVLIVVLLSVGVPNFGQVVDLVGGIVCSWTGYCLPPLLYMRLRTRVLEMKRTLERATPHDGGGASAAAASEAGNDGEPGDAGDAAEEESANSTWSTLGHLLIVAFGLVTMVFTTLTNVLTLTGKG